MANAYYHALFSDDGLAIMEKCPVCQDMKDVKDMVTICESHTFHVSCRACTHGLAMHRTVGCPMCRGVLSFENAHELPSIQMEEEDEEEEDEEEDEEEMANSVLVQNSRNQSAIAREPVADKRRRGRVPELRVGDLVTVKYNKVAMDAYIIKYSKGKYDVRYIETKKIQRNFPKKYLFAKVL